jgi:peroxiredoxin
MGTLSAAAEHGNLSSRRAPKTARLVVFGALAVLGLLSLAVLLLRPATNHQSHTSPIPGIALGAIAPDFELHDQRGNAVQLSRLRGRWILLNFWGVTCPPCRSEMPALERAFAGLSRRANETALSPTILGVDGDLDPADTIYSFARSLHVTYPILADSNLTVMARYHIGALPTSLVIDPSGLVTNVYLGPMSTEQIAKALNERA